MKSNLKKSILLVLAIALLFGTASCNAVSPTEKDAYSVVDMTGKTVTFGAVPEKVVSLLPSATEVLFDLGVGDKLIAVSNYCNYPAEGVAGKTKLDSGQSTNIEAIIDLEPDVIFMGKMSQTIEQAEQLEDAGIRVVIADAYSIDECYDAIKLISDVMSCSKAGLEIIAEMKYALHLLKETCADITQKTVYIEISPLEYGLWTTGQGTFQQELFNICNIKNIFDDTNGWVEVSEEQVIERNPQIIITTCSGYTTEKPEYELTNRANWSKIDAIKNGRVIFIDPDILSRPTKRLVEGAQELSRIIELDHSNSSQ